MKKYSHRKFVKRGMTRTFSAVRHLQDRFRQRYGLDVGFDDIASINRAIETKTAQFVRKAKDGKVWMVEICGAKYPVVYSYRAGSVITVL